MFRMRQTVFRRLHDTLVQNYGLVPSRGVSTTEALAIFLWACEGPQSFRQTRNKIGHSLETISRKYSEVFNAIYRMSTDVIKPKDTNFIEIHPRLRETRFWPHFKGCIGAIDGSHFPASVPAMEQAKYIGRHGYASQNVMAVCDFDMRFTFVVTGWPGSVHDTRVLQDTLITYADRFPHPPEGITIFYFCIILYEFVSYVLKLTFLFVQVNTILWIQVIRIERDILHLIRVRSTTFQNGKMRGNLLVAKKFSTMHTRRYVML
jgi:hypothetical protein